MKRKCRVGTWFYALVIDLMVADLNAVLRLIVRGQGLSGLKLDKCGTHSAEVLIDTLIKNCKQKLAKKS